MPQENKDCSDEAGNNDAYSLQQGLTSGLPQAQAAQPRNYIGKVVISAREPAKHNEFYVWAKKEVDIDVGSTFLVAEDERNKIVGLVVDSYSTSTSESAVSEFYSSNVGNPLATSPIEPRVITIYKIRVIRRDPSVFKPPTSRMRVRFPTRDDIEFLNQTIRPENRVLAGFVYSFGEPDDPNSWIPLYYDARYIAGPEGAHVMITGKTGLAAKTSYALFLMFSFLQWARRNGKRVAVVAFNVKQCDLFQIEKILSLTSWSQAEDLIKKYFAGRNDVAEANIGLWRRIRQEFGLESPSDLIPKDNKGKPMLHYWTYNKGQDRCIGDLSKVDEFSYGIKDLEQEELEEILSGGNYDMLTDAQKDFVSVMAHYIYEQVNIQGDNNITFQKLYNDANDFLKKGKGSLGSNNQFKRVQDLWRFDEKTVNVMARKIINFFNKNKNYGLEMNRQEGNPIKDTNIHEGINIIQLNFDSEAMQRMVFSAVLRRLLERQDGSDRFDNVLIFVDELNKFAPRNESSPIKNSIIDIAARARSRNVGLIGAQQFASQVDEQVYGNAATYVIGNTDDAELKNEEYRKFSDLRSLIPVLSQGEAVIYQPASYSSPVKVRFPIPLHHLLVG